MEEEPLYMRALEWVFPRRCPVCAEIVEQDCRRSRKICPDCYRRLRFVSEPRCRGCGRRIADSAEELCENCRRHSFHFEYGLVLLDYNEETMRSMADIKYKGRREYLDFYAEETVRRLGEQLRRLRVDGLVPVPVHRKRRIQRGYNQAEILARGIGRRLGLPVYPQALRRRRNTQALKELDAGQRRQALRTAICPGKLPENARALLLVDDILTTGATMESCANALRAAGAERIYSFCLCAKSDASSHGS